VQFLYRIVSYRIVSNSCYGHLEQQSWMFGCRLYWLTTAASASVCLLLWRRLPR